jgi:hypothetical protein
LNEKKASKMENGFVEREKNTIQAISRQKAVAATSEREKRVEPVQLHPLYVAPAPTLNKREEGRGRGAVIVTV